MGRRGNGEGTFGFHKPSGQYMGRYWVETPTGSKRKTIYGGKREDVAIALAEALSNRSKGFVYGDDNLKLGA